MKQTNESLGRPGRTNRRGLLKRAAGAAALGMTALGRELPANDKPTPERAVKNGRIKQSIVYWCFEPHWDMEQACRIAKQLGCESIELIAPKFFPTLKQHGLSLRDRNRRHEPRSAVCQGVQ